MVFFIPSTRLFNGALVLTAATSSSVFLLFGSTTVDAHGYVSSPLAEFKDGAMPTKYSATMTPAFQGKFDDNPQANVDTFTKAFKGQSEFKTLRDLLKDHGADCGDSKPDASRKAIPGDGKVVWQNPDSGEGFVPSHTGPCEIWLDDKRVFSDENCAGHFTSKPKAELPVDFSSCKENCLLQFYWLALHEPTWQVYKNCVPLMGNGGSNGNEGDNNGKSLTFASTNAYNSPSETPPASPSPSLSPSPSSEYANEYDSPTNETPSVSPNPSPSSSQSSESSPAANEYGSPSTTPAASPSPSASPNPSVTYAEPQLTPEATQQQQGGPKKCKSHA